MNLHELNEKIEKLLNEEAARIGNIVINNEDRVNEYGVCTEKFAHFHWYYNHNVHFKFGNRCPRTKSELKKLIAFPEEMNILSSKDYKDILKDLNSTYNNKKIYDLIIDKWKDLHPNRNLNKELILL